MARVQLSIPDAALEAIDAAAAKAGETRSAFLARAGLKAAGQGSLTPQQRREIKRAVARAVDEL